MHASNPVNWYPWGEEAFKEAQVRELPIFLSIGYAACHWCHVMEQECFSDSEVASLLNDNFISIKVDREERPDIDQMYMMVCQMMTGSGGWPMSIFLNSDREPFYATTYIPKYSRTGVIGMMDLIPYIGNIWKTRHSDVNDTGTNVIQAVTRISEPHPGDLSEGIIHQAFKQLAASYDPRFGGFSNSPKFPSVPQLFFLFRYYHRYSADKAWQMAEHTLRQMAVSGIRDHLDGGFHRYSTDRTWKLPHFEKMLYDQALLASVYCEAYRISHEPLFKTTAEGILDYVLNSLTDPEGGFWSSVDADSPGGEGVYYLWTAEEVMQILGEDDGPRFCKVYGIIPEGNISGHGIVPGSNVLHPGNNSIEILKEQGVVFPEVWLKNSLENLLKARSIRKIPAVDDKVLTDWNGLMISALVQGYNTFGSSRYYDAGVRAATFLVEKMIQPDGRLIHNWHKARTGLHGMSCDYLFLATALLDLFQADGDVKWMDIVTRLVHQMDFRFWDSQKGGYYISDTDAVDLPVRLMDTFDNALPSANGTAALLMQRLALVTGYSDYSRRYDQIIRMIGGTSGQNPGVILSFFCALIERQVGFRMLVLFPDLSEEIRDLLKETRSLYIPGNNIIPIFDKEKSSRIIPEIKEYPDKPALHICGYSQCYPPVYSKKEFDIWRSQVFKGDNSRTTR